MSKLEKHDKNINFVCLQDKCTQSCCGPFHGVKSAISSVDKRPFSEIVLTPKDQEQILKAGHSNLTEFRDNYYRMRLYKDGSCHAFINGKCSIHKNKPTLCKAFPFYIDMFAGLCAITDCPGFGKGWSSLENLQTELEATMEMYSFWLEWIKK